MTLSEIVNEIESIIRRSPYTRAEVLSIFTMEEKELEPDEIFAYGIALDYLKNKKSGDYKRLQELFLKKKDKLSKFYAKNYER